MTGVKKIDPQTQANVDSWLNGDYDDDTKSEVRRLQADNPEELVNAFYRRLAFGTGGLRGILGTGCNRMNVYTVRAASQGLAAYVNRVVESGERSVVICYDSRKQSDVFAREAAQVFAGNGIKAYLFQALRPVPLLSFACRYLDCNTGGR